MDIFKVRDYSGKYNKLVKRDCVICNKEFEVPNNQINVVTTCCHYCQTVALSLKKSKGRYTLCRVCDKPIWEMPSRKHNYCSKECHNKGMSIFPDENNFGIIQTGRKKYYGGNWLSQRKKARMRDNYKCVRCGISEKEYGKELSVHHIKPFVYFDSYREANELVNLDSVCEPCHRKIHSGKNHMSNFDKDKIVFDNELNTVWTKQKDVATKVVDLLINSSLNLKDISRETKMSYTGVLRIYKGQRWTELYDKPPILTNPRKKSSYAKNIG